MATEEAEPGAASPSGSSEEIPTGKAVSRTPLSARRFTNPELPLVERGAMPGPPRRRIRLSAPGQATAAGATPNPAERPRAAGERTPNAEPIPQPETVPVKPPPTGTAAADVAVIRTRSRETPVTLFLATSAAPLPADSPAAKSSPAPARTPEKPKMSESPDVPPTIPSKETPKSSTSAMPHPPARRPNYAVGATVLCLALLTTGFFVVKSGALGTPPAANETAASSAGSVVAAAPEGGTGIATSNELAAVPTPTRSPGLPDTALTPGESTSASALPENAGELAAAPPAISPEVRQEVLTKYGIPASDADRTVLSYLIPPSLNGANSASNVFPVTPWFADLKGRLDRQLTQKVIGGEVTLAAAHDELKANWIAAAHRHYVRNYGEQSAEEARKIENRLNWEKTHPGSSKPIESSTP